jgi:hypothetical protein
MACNPRRGTKRSVWLIGAALAVVVYGTSALEKVEAAEGACTGVGPGRTVSVGPGTTRVFDFSGGWSAGDLIIVGWADGGWWKLKYINPKLTLMRDIGAHGTVEYWSTPYMSKRVTAGGTSDRIFSDIAMYSTAPRTTDFSVSCCNSITGRPRPCPSLRPAAHRRTLWD